MPLIDDHSLDHAFYPDSDDEPMAESVLQAEVIRALILGFQRLYLGRPDVVVVGDAFWYPVKGQPKVVLAPDTMVVVDLPSLPDFRTMGSYRQFEYGGRVALAVEVLSPSNTAAEMRRKRQFYEAHGAAEYWEYDPESATLEVWVRHGDEFVPMAVPADGLISPATGVRVGVADDMLAVYNPGSDRRWLMLADEAGRMVEVEAAAERAHAEAARVRAEAARIQAEALQRIAELEAQLAALRGDAT
ncbi:MAG: Uma2 family endonuclease [Ilumatobacteraceae bacterium]